VARTSTVLLPSSVEHLGRKCDNASCLVREQAAGGRFMRCSGCKVRVYCSQHCQVGLPIGMSCIGFELAGGLWHGLALVAASSASSG
jgi:hypothetical protein